VSEPVDNFNAQTNAAAAAADDDDDVVVVLIEIRKQC